MGANDHCCAIGCNNRRRKVKVSFHRIPARPLHRRFAWLRSIGKEDLRVTNSTRLCGAHFVKGHPVDDPHDIDYVPTIFLCPPDNAAAASANASHNSTIPEVKREPVDISVDQNDPARPKKRAGGQEQVNAAVQCALHLLPSSPAITEALQTRSSHMTPSTQHFSIGNIKKDPEYLELYSNFPGLEHFSSCFSLVKSMNSFEKPESNLSLEDEFFLTVVRLTLGVPVFDLSYRFAISRQSASRIFMKWLSGMYKAFRQIIIWPTKDVVKKFMPAVFQRHFPTTRCLISIIEIPTERQLATHSESTPHSNRSTLKALIAMTPSGCLSFASEPIPGTCSDSELFVDSGILSKLERGDSIIAPVRLYGQIKDICEMRGITALPLTSTNKARRAVADDQDGPMSAVLSLRICEREVERILKYRILEFVPNALCCTGLINKIFYVCAFLTNYYPPLVSEAPVGS